MYRKFTILPYSYCDYEGSRAYTRPGKPGIFLELILFTVQEDLYFFLEFSTMFHNSLFSNYKSCQLEAVWCTMHTRNWFLTNKI